MSCSSERVMIKMAATDPRPTGSGLPTREWKPKPEKDEKGKENGNALKGTPQKSPPPPPSNKKGEDKEQKSRNYAPLKLYASIVAVAAFGFMTIFVLQGALKLVALIVLIGSLLFKFRRPLSARFKSWRGVARFLKRALNKVVVGFIWVYLKKFGRPIGNRTKFAPYRKPPMSAGPRKWIYGVTGGRWNFGRSASERCNSDSESIQRIETANPTVAAVHSRAAGGVGKTTISVAVGQSAAADLENISVLLAEINPQGSVRDATGVKREHIPCVQMAEKESDPEKKKALLKEACFTVQEAINNLHKLQSMQDVRLRIPQMPGTGLFVLTHPEPDRIDPVSLRKFVRAMSRIFPASIYDLDQYDSHADTALILELADVVLVPATRRNKARGRQAGEALINLENKYHTRSVLVINRVWWNMFHRSTTRNVRMIQNLRNENGHEPYRGAVGTLPWNFWVALGGRFLLKMRSPWFKRHVRELTALAFEEARKAHRDKLDSPATAGNS
jgi:hypothetical protein